MFAFGWEQIALVLPGYLRRMTLAYYLQSLVPHAMPQDGLGSALQALFRDVPSPLVSLAWLARLHRWCSWRWRAASSSAGEYVLEQ